MTDKIGDIATNAEGHKLVYTENGWIDWRRPAGAKAYAKTQTPEPSALARLGRGMMDVGMGVPQMLGLLSPEKEAEEKSDIALYEQGAGPDVDWWRIGGQAAATAPVMAIPGMGATSLMGRTAAGAAGGGLANAALFESKPGERLGRTVAGTIGGGVIGAVAPPVLKAGAKAASAAGRSVARLWRSMQPKARADVYVKLQAAAQTAGMSLDDLSDGARVGLQKKAAAAFNRGDLDADALIREAQAGKFGFVGEAAPLRGQLTRDARQFSDEMNLAKKDGAGDALANRYNAQGARAKQVLEETQQKIGGAADVTIDDAGEAIEAAAQKRARDWQVDVSAKYKAAQEAGADVLLPGYRLKHATSGVIAERQNAIPADVSRRIVELTKDGGEIGPVQLENLDKLISEYYGADRATNSALSILHKNVRDLMSEAGEEFGGAYKEAVAEAAKRFSAIGPKGKLTDQLVRGVFDPEKVAPKLMSGPVRQIENLKAFVAESNPQAWNDATGAVWNTVIEKSHPSGAFSQAAYNRTVKNIGRKRLSVLYGDDIADEIISFGKVAENLMAFPAGHRVNTSNTASDVYNTVRSALSGLTDIIPGGRILTPLIDAGRVSAGQSAQKKVIEAALSGAPSGAPLTQLPQGLDSLLSRGGMMAPAASVGLLGANR